MRNIKLNARLSKVASFVRNNSKVADIGTDHGYLPIWLVINEVCEKPIAVDLKPGPLGQAKRMAVQYGVRGKLDFRLGDGLKPIKPFEVDTITIAGMGGETILNIISQAEWLLDSDAHLILQPQSKIPELLEWLYKNGFAIEGGSLVRDAGKIYMVLSVKKGKAGEYTIVDCHLPKVLIDAKDPLFNEYLHGLIRKYQSTIVGLGKSASEKDRAEEYKVLVKTLITIKEGIKLA